VATIALGASAERLRRARNSYGAPMNSYVVCVGLATLDSIFEVPAHPEEDGRVIATGRIDAGGGTAATTAVTLARLGIDTFFVGSVADDEVGKIVRKGLEREGVDVSELMTAPSGAQSPQSAVLVNQRSATRTVVHYPGTLPPIELGDRARELCRGAEWVHVDHVGYGPLRDLVREVRLSIDNSHPIGGLELDGVALYAPTEPELRALFPGPEAAIEAGAELVVVTRGTEGSSALARDGTVVESPGLRIAPVSTLGADPVFRGALLAQFISGVPLRQALVFAHACAALSCRALDGRSAIPSAPEVAAIVP
jgi:sugar/nucleoside kinase (ribokinase family)